MAKYQTHEHVILELIDSAFKTAKTTPLNLGGISGTGGGLGQPPGGYIGQLPQTKVSYDTTEAATLFTPASGMSLVDNLNHIRYWIEYLQDAVNSGGSALVVEDWDGNPSINNVNRIVFSGGVVTDLGAGRVLVQISGGGGSFSGDPFSVVLTDDEGNAFTPTWLKWGEDGADEFVEWGADVAGKETNAGKIKYNTADAEDYFDIFGAGSATPRRVRVNENLYITTSLFIGATQIDPTKQVTNGDTHDHNGGDGNQIDFQNLTGQFNDSEGTPANLSNSSNVDGTSTYAARRDHAHQGFNDGEGNPAQIGTGADGTSAYAARRDHVHEINNSFSALGSTFSITGTAGTYQDTGLAITLPSAGTYKVTANVRGRMIGNAGTVWWIHIKLRNSTDSTDVTNSERLIVLTGTTGLHLQNTCPIDIIMTVDGAKTIQLHAPRNGSGSPSWTASTIESDANGRTVMMYEKIA